MAGARSAPLAWIWTALQMPVFHIACSATASLRATATRAFFLKPPALASFRPQSLRAQGLVVRVGKVVAAS